MIRSLFLPCYNSEAQPSTMQEAFSDATFSPALETDSVSPAGMTFNSRPVDSLRPISMSPWLHS